MDEEAAKVEAEVAPCVTNYSIHACCSGVNTGPGVGVPSEVCWDAIDWRGQVGVVDSG